MCLVVFVSFRGSIPTGEDLIMKDDVVKLKRCIYSAQVRVLTQHFDSSNLGSLFASNFWSFTELMCGPVLSCAQDLTCDVRTKK